MDFKPNRYGAERTAKARGARSPFGALRHLRNREDLVGAVLAGVGKIFTPTGVHGKRG